MGLRIADRIRASGTQRCAARGSPSPRGSPSRVGDSTALFSSRLRAERGGMEEGFKTLYIYICSERGRRAHHTHPSVTPRPPPTPPRVGSAGGSGLGGGLGDAHAHFVGFVEGEKWSGGRRGGWMGERKVRARWVRSAAPGMGTGGFGGFGGAVGGLWGGGGRCHWGIRRGWGTETAVHCCAQNSGAGRLLGHGGVGGCGVRFVPHPESWGSAQHRGGGTVRGFPLFGKVQKERRGHGGGRGMLVGGSDSLPPPVGSHCRPTLGAAFGVSLRCVEPGVPSTIFCVREGFPTSGKR